MELFIGLLITAAFIALFALGVKYIGRPMVMWVESRRLQREAETDLYRQINYARAQQAAADKILRRNGQKP